MLNDEAILKLLYLVRQLEGTRGPESMCLLASKDHAALSNAAVHWSSRLA